MGKDIELSLAETNALREQLGLKPISASSDSPKQSENEIGDRICVSSSNGETQIDQDIEFGNSFKDGEQATNSYKSGLLRNRLAKLNAKHKNKEAVASNDDQNWLDSVRKENTKAERKIQMRYEEEEINDLPLLKTSHALGNLRSGKEVILTLRESAINDSEQDDVLENEKHAQEKVEAKNIQLRQMNRERRRKKMKLQLSSIDIDGENERSDDDSMLVIGAESSLPNESQQNSEKGNLSGKIKVNFEDNDSFDDGGDYKPVKIKRRNKLDIKSSSQTKRMKLPKEIKKVELIDEDLISDNLDIFQVSRTGKNKSLLKEEGPKTTEDLALEIRREKLEREKRSSNISYLNDVSKRLVVDESATFLDSLKSNIIDDTANADDREIDNLNTAGGSSPRYEPSPSSLKKNNTTQTRPSDFFDGIASTLQFLQKKNVLSRQGEVSPKEEPQGISVSEVRNAAALNGQQTQQARTRITSDESAGRPAQLRNRFERERAAEQVNVSREPTLEDYNPEIRLIYKDKKGNELTTREAYKKLSQKFHGTKSNKKKQAKSQSKIEARNRQAQAQDTNAFDIL